MSKTPHLPKLPKGFIWGASTAAAQIEGAAADEGRGASIWDAFAATPGKIKDGSTPAAACDHYHLYKEDVALMKRLGLDAYRFSVSWSRVMPDGAGAVNDKGLDFYDRLIDELLASGVEPWLCLYHWDLPQALHEKGGWTNRDAAHWFTDYAALIAERFGDRVARWATFNEPGVFTTAGYAVGYHAPGIADLGAYLAAAHNVNRSHGGAVRALRAAGVKGQIGVVCNQQPARPATPSDEDKAAATLYELFWNRTFADPMILGSYPEGLTPFFGGLIKDGDLEAIREPLDFLGVNHYSPTYVKSDPSAPGGLAQAKPPEGAPVTMMGWEIAPKAFAQTLIQEYARYKLPIVVTENGVADRAEVGPDGEVDDRLRIDYLSKYVGAVASAIDAGARIDGYFVWSLIDNFEWAEGYEPRFGVVHVDFTTQKRTPKRSFDWMRKEIRRQ
ncbi:MAG: beta-glucosidase [Alphaproteobacteria bacterium RIFCSPHIGHO2_12_FULL_63_12]|nr:MAG: beta-glucosidase [Alphaproteobacteria bacterium RIFCSPHIGHO2_12_FULL_63_12]